MNILDEIDPNNERILIRAGSYNYFFRKKILLCGIYVCFSKINGKVYIGSSYDFKMRVGTHTSSLKCGFHCNSILQAAYDKYGINNFEWYFVKSVPEENLLIVEQEYLDKFDPFGPRGYNISRSAIQSSKRRRTSDEEAAKRRGGVEIVKIKDPTGKIHEFRCSVSQFEKDNGISRGGLVNVLSGKSRSWFGWCLPETTLEDYKLKSPTGEIVTFRDGIKFAKENGVDSSSVYKVLKGTKKSIKGWTLPEVENARNEWSLRCPDGGIFKFESIIDFCKQHEFNYDLLVLVLKGKRESYLGWTLPHKEFTEKSYNLIHESGKVAEFTSIRDFSESKGLVYKDLLKVLIKKKVSVGGWRLTKEKKKKAENSYSLKSPNGKIFTFDNIRKFKEEHGLPGSIIGQLLLGKVKSSQGWTLPENDLPRVRVITFKSPQGELIETSNLGKFAKQIGKNYGNLTGVVSGRLTSYGGWMLNSIRYENFGYAIK